METTQGFRDDTVSKILNFVNQPEKTSTRTSDVIKSVPVLAA